MSILKEIDSRLGLLKSSDPNTRDLAAAEITDYLEADALTAASLRRVLRILMDGALREQDASARESLFNALSTAAEVSDVSGIDWQPLAARLDELEPDCLEHALVILGFSGDARYRPRIERLLTHPDEGVRTEADDALRMIKHSGAKAAKVKKA